jgi:hypothetical protein
MAVPDVSGQTGVLIVFPEKNGQFLINKIK